MSRRVKSNSVLMSDEATAMVKSCPLEVVGYVVVWYLSSMVAITTSKECMRVAPVPLLLCVSQFLTASMATRLYLGLFTRSNLSLGDKGDRSFVMKIAASYSLGFFLTNLSLSLADASFVETLKTSEPVGTALLAAVFLGEVYGRLTYISLAPIVLGISAATFKDKAPVLSYAAPIVLLSNCCFSMRSIFLKLLKRDHPESAPALSGVVLFYHVSRFGAFFFLCATVISGDFDCLRDSDRCGPATRLGKTDSAKNATDFVRFGLLLAVNGLAYSAYNLASFLVLQKMSATSHAVLNVVRRVFNILVAFVHFQTTVDATSLAGIFTAVAGVFLYAFARQRELNGGFALNGKATPRGDIKQNVHVTPIILSRKTTAETLTSPTDFPRYDPKGAANPRAAGHRTPQKGGPFFSNNV